MRRTSVLAAFLVLGAFACHRDYRPGTSSLTSAPITEERVPAPAVVPDPRIPATSGSDTDAGATESSATPQPLVTPGLDNTVTGGVANTGVPLNYGPSQ